MTIVFTLAPIIQTINGTMRTLYLHIGYHKTASSSLQLALKRHADRLLEQGYEFVSLGKNGNSSAAVDVRKENGGLSFGPNRRLEQLLANSRGERVIVSGEHFSFLHSAEDIEQVRACCEKFFDDVVVIVYLRRQDRQAMSFKQQSARASERDWSSSSKLMGHSEGAFPELNEAVKTYYDYFAKLQLWEQSFGLPSLRVRDFDVARESSGDIVTDFAALLGDGVQIPPCRVNEGVCRKQFLLTHKLVELGVARWEIDKLKPKMVVDTVRLTPSRASALAFFLQFEVSNRNLNDRFLCNDSGLAFSDDFSAYPREGNDRISFSDLSRWTVDLFEAGLENPLGLRDALLADRLQALLTADCADGILGGTLGEELSALAQCLAQTAKIAQPRAPWYRRIRKQKTSGR
ncbi:hypothetical protein [Microbulbifer marinus]|uniref:Uncharacterized protein n=1 Tax=Microbulbifer marinus TaxID=658218 RepID=A0A1H3X463_9GAMM|nr:hypothetical protein [Microbulbifer marinus]SDZ94205.1 hypothetical protein SAMN05216562_1328 [Microbulbifer marinus]